MKRIKLFVSLFVLVCVFLCGSRDAFADEYTYKVRVFAGNQGTIDGRTVVVNPASFSPADVSVTSDRYFAKGIRESGKDINPYRTGLPNSVDHDTDYVVVYGLNTNLVTLTIRYVSTSGAQLADNRVLYGNVDDVLVVNALYIDGYAPEYLQIKGTLTVDTTWEFRYYESSNTTVIYGGGGGGGAGIPIVGPNGNAGTAGAGNQPVTQEILDLDTPLAGPDAGTTETPAPSPTPNPNAENRKTLLEKFGMIILWIILLAGLAFLYWFFLFYRKKKQSEQETKGPGAKG